MPVTRKRHVGEAERKRYRVLLEMDPEMIAIGSILKILKSLESREAAFRVLVYIGLKYRAVKEKIQQKGALPGGIKLSGAQPTGSRETKADKAKREFNKIFDTELPE